MWKAFAALALGLVLASCDVSGLVPQDHQDFAKRVVTMIQARDVQGVRNVSDASIREQITQPLIDRMAGFFPAETVSNISIKNWKSSTTGGPARVDMVMIYKYPARDVCVDMVFNIVAGQKQLTGVHVYPQGCPKRDTSPTTPAAPGSNT